MANVISGDENRSALRSSLSLDERANAHAGTAAVGIAQALGDPGRFEAAVDGDRTPSVLAAPRLGVVVRAQQVLERDRAVGPREHAGNEVGRDEEP